MLTLLQSEKFFSPHLSSQTRLSESALRGALKTGEWKAIQYLYDKYSASLFGIIIRVLKDDKEADDVLQDTFIKIWKSYDLYDSSKGRLFTWMANVARNLAIDYVRSKQYQKKTHTCDISENIGDKDVKYAVKYNPDTIGLRELIKDLRIEHQLILELIYFRGYTHIEAAEELNIPIGTIKTRLRAGVLMLRKMF